MAAEAWRAEWASRKAAIAGRLFSGECGGSYSEAVLVLCAAISAIAAEAWPGKGIDRARFVELLARLDPQSRTVSVPLLVGELSASGRHAEANRLQKAFLPVSHSEVVTGPQVDKMEKQIRVECPELRLQEIREFSYANLLYERLRSPMVHEYRTGERTVPYPMTAATDPPVSYYNWIPTKDKHRHIYFHVPWLAALLTQAAIKSDADASLYPLAQPLAWWITGAEAI